MFSRKPRQEKCSYSRVKILRTFILAWEPKGQLDRSILLGITDQTDNIMWYLFYWENETVSKQLTHHTEMFCTIGRVAFGKLANGKWAFMLVISEGFCQVSLENHTIVLAQTEHWHFLHRLPFHLCLILWIAWLCLWKIECIFYGTVFYYFISFFFSPRK